jgi:RNA polymerase sigma factor (sigma-70 family)
MADERSAAVLRHVQAAFNAGAVAGLSDGQLLERFARRRDTAAEVCRRVLTDTSDIEDAFQATFLVLVRKAGSIRVEDSLGRWLYGVSRRVALRAKAIARRRSARECPLNPEELTADTCPDAERFDLRSAIDEELGRLAEKYRTPIVLCYLEGRTHEEAARQLGWPVGTVRGRLARARELLRTRLTRRGLAPLVGLLDTVLASEGASAAVPEILLDSTVKAAMRTMAGRAATGVVSVSVAALAEGVLSAMFLTKLKLAAVVLLGIGTALTGAGVLVAQSPETRTRNARAHGESNPGSKEGSDRKSQAATVRPSEEERAPAREDPGLEAYVRNELELLTVQLEAKKAALRKAEAQKELSTARVALTERLRIRDRNSVSLEAVSQAEAEVKIAQAECDIKRAEVEEVQIRLDRMKRLQADPERSKERLDAADRPVVLGDLERRMRDMERKLDQILKAIEGSSRRSDSR